MSRRDENISIEQNGYHQGEKSAESCQCYDCQRKVSGTRGWWKFDPDSREVECFCRPCAVVRAVRAVRSRKAG